MSPEEQRIVIATVCGWEKEPCEVVPVTWGASCKKPTWYFIHQLPDYLNNLDDMNAAEKILWESPELLELYEEALQRIYLNKVGYSGAAYWFMSSASTRAEAFLKTLNLWK